MTDLDVRGVVRVATWNVWWRFGPWENRARAIQEVLRALDADVCTLQEVWADGHTNLACDLADGLGYDYAWAPSPQSDRWCRRLGVTGVQIGHAILSRWPLSRQAQHPLPPGDDPDEGRLALVAETQTPWGSMPVMTLQLNSHPAQSATRSRQAEYVASLVANLAPGAFPPVVTGDFNAQPASDEVRRFEGHLTPPVIPGQVLIDAWRYAPIDDPGLTWDRRCPHVAATLEPSARIDYIFVGLPTATGRGHVGSIKVFGNHPIDGIWPSDHFGVVAELAV